MGAPKGVAEGVPSALRPDLRRVAVSGITPGLTIRTTGIPQADWLCACGHFERARGRAAVTQLADRVRVGHCPHRAPHHAAQEGRNAA
ncbi:hypothetical protein [Streptomyces sp. NPDC018031]|uniref:hypothetical protein n=1 Tax=Streptomyces sp. NPDC018031 TaxID=3365033 RepID=UPI0037A31D5D